MAISRVQMGNENRTNDKVWRLGRFIITNGWKNKHIYTAKTIVEDQDDHQWFDWKLCISAVRQERIDDKCAEWAKKSARRE